MYKSMFIVSLLLTCGACGPATDSSSLNDIMNSVASPAGYWRPHGFNICSKLDFENLVWPGSLSQQEKDAFGLALNISGSFEGSDGWRNITNNFDGEGLSLGLLNQCLGEGSLQPLLLEMIQAHGDLMRQIFIGANFTSLNGMLDHWQKRGVVAFNDGEEEEGDAFESAPGFSPLDDEEVVADFLKRKPKPRPKPKPKPKTRNQESVDWAKKNLYVDGKGVVFLPMWMDGLTMMADSAEYRSLQLAKAFSLHQGAMALFHHFKMTQLRSYLFFFDLMVQNGGINSDLVGSIDGALSKKPHTETEKLEQILAMRLKFVRKKYAADVKARKQSLINGGGVVHGHRRDYSLEYCAEMNSSLTPISSELAGINL